jgi:signal transduction histidine kinase
LIEGATPIDRWGPVNESADVAELLWVLSNVGVFARSAVRESPIQKMRMPVDMSDPSRWRPVSEAIMNGREPWEFKPILKSICRMTSTRAQWLALGLLISVGGFSFWNTSALIATNNSQIQLRLLLSELQAFLSTVTDAETGQRGYLLIGEDSYLEPFDAALKVADQQSDQVEKLIDNLPDRRSTFAVMQQLVAAKFKELTTTVHLRQREGIQAAMQVVRAGAGQKLMEEIRGLANQIEREIQDRLAKHDRQATVIAERATHWSIAGNVLAALLFVLVIQRELRDRIRVSEQNEVLEQHVLDRTAQLGAAVKEIGTLNEELEQHVLDRTAQLETAIKELDSFSYSVSHDLRAPLRAIDGFSRIVLEDYGATLASEGKAYLQMVRDNTRQMGQLVDDLLAFARLGRQSLTKQTVDPDSIVRRCLEEMVQEQVGREVEIVIGDLPTCHADPTLIKQVWTNLLANALKYTRKREVARIEIGSRIEPRVEADGQPAFGDGAGTEVIYFVKDNGAGFDMKYAGKLFGVFQRLHRSVDYEGTGVGLAIVQRIVQRHGGRIWAEAKLDEGATFSFTLESGSLHGGS